MKNGIVVFIKIVIFFVGWALLLGVVDISVDNPVLWRFYAELIPLISMLVFTGIFLVFEKGKVRIPIFSDFAKGTLVGTISGVIWIGLALAIMFGTNLLVIIDHHIIKSLWIWIVSAFINVIMQELLVRGYIYQLLKSKYNLYTATFITTAIFTFMHGGAFEAGVIPVINVITMCLFTTALYESERTLMAPIMAHAIWNISGAIIFGVVSLADDYPSMFSVLSSSNNEILSGGVCKIEGSIIVTIINIIFMIFFCKRSKIRACNKKIQ